MHQILIILFTIIFLIILPETNSSIAKEKSPILSAALISPQLFTDSLGLLTPVLTLNISTLEEKSLWYDKLSNILLVKQFSNLINKLTAETAPAPQITYHKNNFILKQSLPLEKHYVRLSNIFTEITLLKSISNVDTLNYIKSELLNECKQLNFKPQDKTTKFDLLLEINPTNSKTLNSKKLIYLQLSNAKYTVTLYKHKFKNGVEKLIPLNYFTYTKKPASIERPVELNVPISSKFGIRIDPIYHRPHFHRGVDFAVKQGTPIKAAFAGTVEYVGTRGGYGKYLKLKHINNYATAYAHLSKYNTHLKVGSIVNKGDIIAYSGNTGKSTAPHLHFEVIYKGKQVDPLQTHIVSKVPYIDIEETKRFKKTIDYITLQLDANPNLQHISNPLFLF